MASTSKTAVGSRAFVATPRNAPCAKKVQATHKATPKRGAVLRAVAEDTTEVDVDAAKGYIKTEDFPAMSNIESYAEDTSVGGSEQRILFVVPGGVGEALHFLPIIETVAKE
eukprot:gene2275-2994_t